MPYLRPATDAPFGFLPADGSTARVNHYSKLTSTPAIFAGDLVKLNSSGQVVSATAITDVGLLGVAAESIASGSTTTCAVYDDPAQLFVVQEDSVGTAMSQTLVGNVADVTGFTPGTAAQVLRNRSIMQVDTSTATALPIAGASGAIKIIALSGIESGFPSAAGSPRKIVVMINPDFHLYASGSGV
jgi:hypothetical protein